jgi:CelD/BcsL family acetyltransferase involved in cellulose biosynthesis
MNTKIVRNWPEFDSLEADWNELLSRSKANAIFLRWEWIRAWVDAAGKTLRPFVVCARDSGGRLCGLAPLYLSEFRLGGVIPYRALRVMGDYGSGADYLDWIMREDCQQEATLAIMKTLDGAKDQWDCIWVPNVSGWTGAFERISSACEQERFFLHERPRDFSSFELPNSMEAYLRSQSQNMRQQVKGDMKRVLGRNGISISHCRSEEELSDFLEALFKLHYLRWKQAGELGTFRRKPVEERFYRLFTPVALRNGWLRISGLKEQGEFKAVQLGYVYRNVFHQMQEGFDPEYVRGAGNVLRAKVIEECITEGIGVYDFLGEMTEHKRRWRAKERTGHDLFIGNRNLRNRLLFWKEVWPTGQYLRPAGSLEGR